MSKGARRALFLLLVSALVGTLAGCSSWVRPATRDAVGAALDAANDEANRRKLEALLTSAPVERSLQGLTRSAVDTALGELSSPEREARKRQLAADFVRDIGPVLGETLGRDVLPRVRAELTAGIESALDQALAPASEKRLGAFAAAVARRALGDVGPQVARTISTGVAGGLERSVRAVLARDFGPIVGRTLDANVPVIARVTRAGTEGSLLGVSDAMNGPFGEMVRRERREVLAEAQAAAKAEREAWLGELHTQIDESRRWFRTFVVVAAATGALLIVIGLLLWRLLQDNRRLRQAT